MTTEFAREFHSRICQLVQNRGEPDLWIVCEGLAFPAHRRTVGPASAVFRAELAGLFAESRGTIRHEEFDSSTVARMLQFLYMGDYEVPVRPPHVPAWVTGFAGILPIPGGSVLRVPADDDRLALRAHVRVHAIGSYYQLPALQVCARDKAKATLQACAEPAPDFFALVQRVYGLPASEDRGMRGALAAHCERFPQLVAEGRRYMREVRGDEVAALLADVVESLSDRARALTQSVADLQTQVQTAADRHRATARDLAAAQAESANADTHTSMLFVFSSQQRTCAGCGWQQPVFEYRQNTPDRLHPFRWVAVCRACGARHSL